VEAILSKLEAEVRSVEIDISTPSGRKACASLAYKVARSETALDGMGKQLNDQWRSQAEKVHEERRMIRERLGALKAEVRAPLTEWENAEKARVAAQQALIARMEALLLDAGEGLSSLALSDRLVSLDELRAADWHVDFRLSASRVYESIKGAILKRRDAAARLEAERAELARQQAEEAERQRQEAIRLQAEREAQIAAEAAERARKAAEAEAERQRLAEAERVAAAQRRAEAEARAALEEADRRAAKAEADRVAAIAKAEAERLAAIERAAQAENARLAAIQRAKDDALALAKRVAADRAAAEAHAVRERDAAVAAEQRRVAEAKAAEDRETARRAADLEHRKTVNNQALAELIPLGVSREVGKAIIQAIARGEIPHVSIRY
jgi:hypothetical protein